MILPTGSDILILRYWKGEVLVENNEKICSNDLAGIYCDIANIVGIEETKKLYCCLRGQQITFPTRLYTQEFVVKEVQRRKQEDSIGKLAAEYGYTEKWLRKLLKKRGI